MLTAGTTIADISPEKGVELAGYPHYPRYNTGIHDPLYASCLYLDDGTTKLAIVCMDILFFSKKFVKIVRERVSSRIPLPAKNIMICSSHTHSSPWASGRLGYEALEAGLGINKPYIDSLLTRLTSLIIEAYENNFTARLGTGYGICGKEEGVGGNRLEPEGTSDPIVRVMGVKDSNEILKAILVKYSLHPTVIHEENTLVTADYPGYIREYLKKVQPSANLLFAQGTSGNQSSRYFRYDQSFPEAKRIGHSIGKVTGNILEKLDFSNVIKLKVYSKEVNLEFKELPSEDIAINNLKKTRSRYEKLKKEGAPYLDIQNANLDNLGAENTLGYIRLMKKGLKIDLVVDELPAEVMVIAIGDNRIVSLPGEIFVEYGLDISKKSPFENTIVIELANGCLPGYICTDDAFRIGTYEVGTTLLSARSGKILVDTAVELLLESSK